jgi:hypothetical protein
MRAKVGRESGDSVSRWRPKQAIFCQFNHFAPLRKSSSMLPPFATHLLK